MTNFGVLKFLCGNNFGMRGVICVQWVHLLECESKWPGWDVSIEMSKGCGAEWSDSDSDKSLAVGGNVPAKVRKVRIQKWGGGCPQKNRIYI